MLVRHHFRGALLGTLSSPSGRQGSISNLPWGFCMPGVPRGRCSHAALCPGKAVSRAVALKLVQVLKGLLVADFEEAAGD